MGAVTGPQHTKGRSAIIPRPAALATTGLVATIIIVCGAVALRSPDAVQALEVVPPPASASPETPPSAGEASGAERTPEPPPRITATPEELEAAQAAGVPALAALLERFPKDPTVLRALALTQGRERSSLMAALTTLKRLFELAPTEAANAELRPLLLRAANATPDLAAVTFDLLAKRMGSHGPDLLYEIAINPGMGKHPVERANTLLAEEGVRSLASKALLVADDLRRMKRCPTKPLIDRARQQGDVRALHYLNPIKKPVKCGFLNLSRCTPCSSVYAETVAAIQEIELRRDGQ
ncbi:Flagellar assembly protein FliH [Chondromyces apiculatus DSM 436]|uniref:Flagellar assembly protein FliH n=1 Tax=Chondromyces apiculatus DSM 436 TaxID=1192034 RepID=A0A017TEJ9_9BACT|nr:Flagellar assembly protein FliH [Chondromyces apiculatus DSM 436]